MAIGGEGKQDQHGSTLGSQACEPVVVEQAVLQPAEAAGGLTDQIRARCSRRSTKAVTELELGNTSFHSAKGLLVVRMMGRCSWRRLTTSKSRSAARLS